MYGTLKQHAALKGLVPGYWGIIQRAFLMKTNFAHREKGGMEEKCQSAALLIGVQVTVALVCH